MVGCGHIKDSDTKNTTFSAMSEIEKREYINKYLKQKYTGDVQCHDEINKKQTDRDYRTTAECEQSTFDLWISPAGEITDTYFDITAKKALTKNLSDIASSYFPSFNLFVNYKFDNYPEKNISTIRVERNVSNRDKTKFHNRIYNKSRIK